MDDARKYWRDKVTQVMGYGTAVLLLVVGFAIDEPQRFSRPWLSNLLGVATTGRGWGDSLRGTALLVVGLGFAVAWPLVLRAIYDRYLSEATDETVLPRRWVMAYAGIVSLLTVTTVLGIVIA